MTVKTMVSEDTEEYWQAARRGTFVLPSCSDGHQAVVWAPPIAVCPQCLNWRVEWLEVSPIGSVVAMATYHRQYVEDFPPPYTVALTQLASGPRVLAIVSNATSASFGVGTRVRLEIQTVASDRDPMLTCYEEV